MPVQHFVRLGVTLLVAIVVLAGCGDDDGNSDSDPTEATEDAATLLSQASDALASTNSLRFNLEIDGTTYVDDNETIRLVSCLLYTSDAADDLTRVDLG